MKKFFAGLAAAVAGGIGLFLLFFRKSPKAPDISLPTKELDKKSDQLKSEVDKLSKKRENLKVEDKTLEEEVKYWENQKK